MEQDRGLRHEFLAACDFVNMQEDGRKYEQPTRITLLSILHLPVDII